MQKEIIVTGETIEIAQRNACEALGVQMDDLEYEILATPTKKTFGLFGGNPAKIRAYINEPDNAERASEYLKTILRNMGLSDIQIEIREVEAGAEFILSGNDIGFIIGHRGETLDSLQYLASLIANHDNEEYYRITLDVGNYREKRKETLESLGKKMALKSIKTGRNNSLEPMNPYERRIIHTAVQEVEGAKSWSEGEDMNRHVVVGPVDGERYQRRDNRRGGNRGGYDKRHGGYDKNRKSTGDYRPRQNQNSNYKNNRRNDQPASAAPRKDALNAPLYGRIDKK